MTEPKHPTLCEGVELTQGEVEEVAAMFQDAALYGTGIAGVSQEEFWINPLEKALTLYWDACDEAGIEGGHSG